MSSTASGEVASDSSSRAVIRRRWPCTWRPSMCSIHEQPAVSFTRRPVASSGSSVRHSTIAAYASWNWPVAT